MKILLTGGTGFLGKYVLDLLVRDPRITRIDAVSRSKRTHPSPKVQLFSVDLSDPTAVNALSASLEGVPSCVIHLAGVYSFKASFAENYQQNVLSTLNLMSLLKEWNARQHVPIIFASTYGVGFGLKEVLGENPLSHMPPKGVPYAFTKAVAERAVADAGVPASLFRLGILTGDSVKGTMEKIDGPYALMGILRKLALSGAGRFMKQIPVPAAEDGILPLVPVDCAAKVFHEAVFRMQGDDKKSGVFIYGVYNKNSERLDSFCKRVVSEYFPDARPRFVRDVPEPVLKAQEIVTGIPKDSLLFSTHPIALQNERFEREYEEFLIPSFQTYEAAFFSGFEEFAGCVLSQGSSEGDSHG